MGTMRVKRIAYYVCVTFLRLPAAVVAGAATYWRITSQSACGVRQQVRGVSYGTTVTGLLQRLTTTTMKPFKPVMLVEDPNSPMQYSVMLNLNHL